MWVRESVFPCNVRASVAPNLLWFRPIGWNVNLTFNHNSMHANAFDVVFRCQKKNATLAKRIQSDFGSASSLRCLFRNIVRQSAYHFFQSFTVVVVPRWLFSYSLFTMLLLMPALNTTVLTTDPNEYVFFIRKERKRTNVVWAKKDSGWNWEPAAVTEDGFSC